MKVFKERVIAHHSIRLEQNITDSFNELLRKRTLFPQFKSILLT